MANRILLLSILFMIIFHVASSRRKFPSNSSYTGPIPPQPSQYTTVVSVNGISAMYYADTTIYRDRIDIIEQNRISIIDFKNERFYDIVKQTCSWMQIPGKILPLLWFPTYEYLGNSTHNKVLCHQWAGCHDYEIPPAPYYYYVTVKDNIPVDLNLYTIDVYYHFSNFTYGPPPPGTFNIPANCTKIDFNQVHHPVYSHTIFNNRQVGLFC